MLSLCGSGESQHKNDESSVSLRPWQYIRYGRYGSRSSVDDDSEPWDTDRHCTIVLTRTKARVEIFRLKDLMERNRGYKQDVDMSTGYDNVGARCTDFDR